MRVISVVNMKGGVGKTTLTVALSETIAAVVGRRVLVLDLDSQASCSFALLGETDFDQMRLEGRHAVRLMSALDPVHPRLAPTADLIWRHASRLAPTPPLSLIGSVPQLQPLERDFIFNLAQAGLPREAVEREAAAHLQESLWEVAESYDYVVIDCPPGISAFTEAALRISDIVIAPVVLEYLPVLGLEAFIMQTVRRLRDQGHFRGKPHLLFNRVQGTLDELRFMDFVKEVARDYGEDLAVLDVRVPLQREFAQIVQPPERPVSYAEKYRNIDVLLDDLAGEVLERLYELDRV
ncbi:MAG: ParA family protein [Caulobacterales bacterium]|nr:ParA family protein [Caulobacterales bacterium]